VIVSLSLSLLGAIFDTQDPLSRQAFEYAVAKINVHSKIFKNSKLVVSRIDEVDALDSYSAYKMGIKFKIKQRQNLVFFLLVCGQLSTGISALFMGQLTPSLEFITTLTRQFHIPVFLSSPDSHSKLEYYIINIYPHYTATSQAFTDLIKFQKWNELAIITEHAESWILNH